MFFWQQKKKDPSGIDYWDQRAKKHGKKAVIDLRHKDINPITERQKKEIFPFLIKQLNKNDKIILDFGCGPGRFTKDLATLTHGQAIGIDPIERFIKKAPLDKNIKYLIMKEGKIPLNDGSVDAVWVCLVLGGITLDFENTLNEINRVLRTNGLLFLVENTSTWKDNSSYWVYRSVEEYQNMFPNYRLEHLHDYQDFDETISILAGRKML